MDIPDRDFQEVLAQLDPETKLLAMEFTLGQDTDDFLKSDLGRTLIGMAHQEFVNALLALEKVPWWRRRKITELQNRAQCARQFCSWLTELLVKGRHAGNLLNQGDSNE